MTFFVTNLCRIFHYNRINSVLMMKIFHYKGNNLIFHSIFKGITLILMFKFSPFLYTRTKYVHFLIYNHY